MSEQNSWLEIQKKPLFDSTVFDQLVNALGVDKAKEFAKSYIEACQDQCNELIKAIEKHDYKKIEFNSHKLSSSTGTYGNTKLHFLNTHIEELAIKNLIPQELKTQEQQQYLLETFNKSLKVLETHLIEL